MDQLLITFSLGRTNKQRLKLQGATREPNSQAPIKRLLTGQLPLRFEYNTREKSSLSGGRAFMGSAITHRTGHWIGSRNTQKLASIDYFFNFE